MFLNPKKFSRTSLWETLLYHLIFLYPLTPNCGGHLLRPPNKFGNNNVLQLSKKIILALDKVIFLASDNLVHICLHLPKQMQTNIITTRICF